MISGAQLKQASKAAAQRPVAAIFLIAPFIGACHAWRLTRANGHPSVIFGWIGFTTFLFVFLLSSLLFLSDYQRLNTTCRHTSTVLAFELWFCALPFEI